MVQRFRVEFGVLALLLGLAAPSIAAEHGAVVSGVVRDVKGVPQMGALVQILSPDSAVRATTFTDMQGRYLVSRLLPGLYGIRASAALFLPVSRDNLRLQPNRRSVVNLTLSGLFNESTWLPARSKAADETREDWNWTLRSSANRPILKLADEDQAQGTMSGERPAAASRLAAKATLTSPSSAFGHGATRVSLRANLVHADHSGIALSTFVGQARTPVSAEMPNGISTAFERRLGTAGVVASRITYESHPEISGSGGGSGLQVMTISSAEKYGIGESAEVEFGNRIQAMSGPVSAVATRPFLRVSAHRGSFPGRSSRSGSSHSGLARSSANPADSRHAGALWTLAYSLATSPDNQDYDSTMIGEADLPAAAYRQRRTETEKGLHQELSLSHQTTATLMTMAYYADDLDRIALSGNGGALSEAVLPIEDAAAGTSGLLIDQSNGAFQTLAPGYQNAGLNIVVTRALAPGMWIALQYSTGTAMAAPETNRSARGNGLMALQARRSQAAGVSVKATLARTGTRLRSSYRWQPERLVTSIDPYDVLAGGNFLSVHLRQPLRLPGVLPEGMEFTVDGANMLGQGRQHFTGRKGSPLYLASSPTSFQAGLAFSF